MGMPPLKTLMGNMTLAVPTENHTHSMLAQLDKQIHWLRVSFKPKEVQGFGSSSAAAKERTNYHT